MALTRSFLRSLGLEEDKISAIVEAHAETVDGLKAVHAETQTKLDTALKDLESAKTNGWEQKYNELNKSFEAFKADTAAKDARAAKVAAYTEMLKEAGVSDKRIATIIKYDSARIDALELDNGTVKDAKDIAKAITADWADFITKTATTGAPVQTPPTTGGGAAVTKEQFAKMGYKARLDLYNTDPDLYKTLSQ